MVFGIYVILFSCVVVLIFTFQENRALKRKNVEITILNDVLIKQNSKLYKLKELKKMLDDGTLDSNEFELMKYELLNAEQGGQFR